MTTNQSASVRAAVAAALKPKRAPRVPVATDQDIRDLRTENADYKNGTTRGQGLVVFVTTKGAKSFRFNYRDRQGANKTHTLGSFGKINYAQAIALFDKAREALAEGLDIRALQLKARKRALTTLQDEFDEWFPVYAETVCEDYADRTKAVFDTEEMAPFRKRRLVSIEMPDLLKFAKGVQLTRSGSYGREVVNLIDKLYEHARAEGRHKGDNPAHGVVKKLKPRDSQPWCALQFNQLPLYFADVAALKANKPSKRITQLALTILPYMTLRPGVLQNAEWSWISWDHPLGPMLIVPAFSSGTKQRVNEKRADKRGKNYVPYFVPLSRQVVALLRELQAITGAGVYLFPGSKSAKHSAPRAVSGSGWLSRLRAIGWDGSTEARAKITVHGFRALLGSTAIDRHHITRRDEHALEFQQDHKLTEGVRAHYTRDAEGSHRMLLLPERVAILQWWADEIDTVLAAKGGRLPPSRVDRATAFASAQPVNNHASGINNHA